MTSCRICLEDMKNPASLPCGHIFCSDCIIATVKAVKPYTHMHPCPICRSLYNIAPINLNVVPPNLRPFVTPSIRRLYIDQIPPQEEVDVKDPPEAPNSSSELARLRAENIALRNNCDMWRKRAEMHGAANLGLLNFARAVRDHASVLARERDEVQKDFQSLKRKIEDDQILKSEEALVKFLRTNSDAQSPGMSGLPDPLTNSLLFAQPPFPPFKGQISTAEPTAAVRSISSDGSSLNSSDLGRPTKRVKIDDLPKSQETALHHARAATTRIAARQREALDNENTDV